MAAERATAAELLQLIASDPEALRELRRLLAADAPAAAPAYTVATLALALQVSQRVIRNAIARGALAAVKRGARWYIAPDAVDAWTRGRPPSRNTPRFARARHPLATTFAQMGDGPTRPAQHRSPP